MIHPQLKKVLKIFDRAGIKLEAEEIINLYLLRCACENTCSPSPMHSIIPPIPGAPFTFCGVDFFPLHMLAETWLSHMWEIFSGNAIMQIAIYIYAHAHSAPGEKKLLELCEKEKAESVIIEWFRNLPLHEYHVVFLCQKLRELDGYQKQTNNEGKREENSKPAIEPIMFVAMMMREFPGTTLDFWLNGVSVKDAIAMMRQKNENTNWALSEERAENIEKFLAYIKELTKKYAILRMDN